MFGKTRVSVDHMRFPEDRREILRSSSDGGHRKSLFFVIIRVIEIVLTFPKVDDFDFFVAHEEKVGRFHISMTDTFALEKRASTYKTAVHCYKFSLGPKHVSFLPFAIKGFKIGIFIHELGDNTYFEGIVAGLA